jgi:hypothetical protein
MTTYTVDHRPGGGARPWRVRDPHGGVVSTHADGFNAELKAAALNRNLAALRARRGREPEGRK